MINMEKLILTDFFTTKSQAVDFTARISELSGKIYEVDFNLEKNLGEYFGVKKKDKLVSLLRENQIPLESSSALAKFLDKIKDTVSTMSTVTLILATEPDEHTLKTISDWFTLNLKRQVLLETEVDESLVAGAVINYQGKRYDSSIRTIIDEIVATYLAKNDANMTN